MAEPLLVVKNLVKEYASPAGQISVLRGVSFELEAGRSLAIMGPSGSGKSTLLNIIGTLDLPTSGEVLIGGRNVHQMGAEARAAFRNSRIGFVFQDHHLLPQCTALENVLIPFLADGRAGSGSTARAKELLELVGLAHVANKFPSELSGGERQRVAVARALARSPALLLCDEPTGSLDAATAMSVAQLIAKVRDSQGASVLLVTHNPAIAEMFAPVRFLADGVLRE